MSGWRLLDSSLTVGEYAKRVCQEIGWPYSGNLTLLCDCIHSLSFSRGVDAWGGFIILMEALEEAKRQGARIDRWFFTDGRYNDIAPAAAPRKQPSSESSPADADLLRKPN